MRTLNDYFIPIGNVDLGGSGDTSDIVTCPDGGLVVGVSFNTTEAIDAAGSCDVKVNGSASTADVDFAITAVNTGGIALADSALYIADHDAVQLVSKDEPTTGIVDCTLIIRR